MPLFDRPFHTADVYACASGVDAGAGTTLIYTLLASAVPCMAPSLSAAEQERFSQTQLVVTHRVHFKADALAAAGVTLARGMKLVVGGASLRVTGINANPPAGTIPALVEVTAENLL